MARRSVLLAVALVIALVGTALIVLYVQGIDKRAVAGQELVEVLAATDTIDPGETVAAAMEAGKFEKRQVRRDDMVDGALSSTGSISDLVSLSTIYAGEQVIAPKFGTMNDTEGLIIPDDKVAISVELSDPARGRRGLQPERDGRLPARQRSSIRRRPFSQVAWSRGRHIRCSAWLGHVVVISKSYSRSAVLAGEHADDAATTVKSQPPAT